jgi:hypothetical protein
MTLAEAAPRLQYSSTRIVSDSSDRRVSGSGSRSMRDNGEIGSLEPRSGTSGLRLITFTGTPAATGFLMGESLAVVLAQTGLSPTGAQNGTLSRVCAGA